MSPWPFEPLEAGRSRAEVHVIEGHAHIILGVSLDGLPHPDRRSILKGSVELRTTLVDPIIVFLVATATFTYDLPFSPWINTEAWCRDLLKALDASAGLKIDVVFVVDGQARRWHRLTTRPTTGPSIAAALRSCSSRPNVWQYESLVEAYQAQFSPNQLLAVSRAQGNLE